MSICLNMIVKNESAIIRSTLENLTSYVKFAYWVICDTGSTDGTQDIIKTFFAEKGIKGELHQDEWKDFGHNRSLALQRAYESKGADYVLIFDADDAFRGTFQVPKLELDRYSCKFGFGTEFTWYRPVFLNNRIKWKYFGVLHEYVDCIEPNYKPRSSSIQGNYYIEARTIGGDRNKDDKKYQKDALLLEKALEEEKDEGLRSRYAFYCAQSFRDCGNLENGIKYYLMRTKMGHFDEEIHVSYYNAGKMMMGLNYPEFEIEKTLLDGWNAMKDRSECLFELAKYFRLKGNFVKSYLYAEMGSKIPFPAYRVLFLHKDVYNYRMKDEAAISAYYLGKHDKALKLNQQALRNHFDQRYVENMKFSIKEVINNLQKPVQRKINVSKNRWSGITMIMNYKGVPDLLQITLNSLFSMVKDIHLIERFIVLCDVNQVKNIEFLKTDNPFLEIVGWKHKSHQIKNLRDVLNRKDRYLFYLEEGWIFLRNKNYFRHSVCLLNLEMNHGQFIYNKNRSENIDDYKVQMQGMEINVEFNPDKNKYYIHPNMNQIYATPSLIKREMFDSLIDFETPMDQKFSTIYQNKMDLVRATKKNNV
jgi:glycosyltransferase involved in cell wall biosynthesis